MGNKKRNALKHGANAREVMLWSEKYEDYEALRAGLYQEFTPSGSTEEYLVRTLLDLRWRRRRLECHEQIAIQKRLDKIREVNENSHHVENLRSLAPKFGEATSVEQVEAVLAPLSRAPSDSGPRPRLKTVSGDLQNGFVSTTGVNKEERPATSFRNIPLRLNGSFPLHPNHWTLPALSVTSEKCQGQTVRGLSERIASVFNILKLLASSLS
jgi:hypothetical protein